MIEIVFFLLKTAQRRWISPEIESYFLVSILVHTNPDILETAFFFSNQPSTGNKWIRPTKVLFWKSSQNRIFFKPSSRVFSYLDGFGTACSRLKFSFQYSACTDLCEPNEASSVHCNHRAVFTRLNTTAFMKFLTFPMRRLLNGGVYFGITFFKSLITVIVNRL